MTPESSFQQLLLSEWAKVDNRAQTVARGFEAVTLALQALTAESREPFCHHNWTVQVVQFDTGPALEVRYTEDPDLVGDLRAFLDQMAGYVEDRAAGFALYGFPPNDESIEALWIPLTPQA